MIDDKALVDKMLNAFEDTPEIASWFEQDGELYDYKMAETCTHLLGMWETMKEAAQCIEAQADAVTQAADEIERLRSALINIRAEFRREGSRHAHLQRVVALQCRAALDDQIEGDLK